LDEGREQGVITMQPYHQRVFALNNALVAAEMQFQADMAAARAQYQAGLNPVNFPAYNAAVMAADRARAQRIDAAYAAERAAAV
jgi:hypothetical protein